MWTMKIRKQKLRVKKIKSVQKFPMNISFYHFYCGLHALEIWPFFTDIFGLFHVFFKLYFALSTLIIIYYESQKVYITLTKVSIFFLPKLTDKFYYKKTELFFKMFTFMLYLFFLQHLQYSIQTKLKIGLTCHS